MKVIMIRHGQADYGDVDKKGLPGLFRDFAHLNEKTIDVIKNMALDKRLLEGEVLITSPMTRAMETASYIMKNTSLDMKVEVNLHEWIPDLEQNNKTNEESFIAYKEFIRDLGVHSSSEQTWETLDSLQTRVKEVLDKYLEYKVVIVVCHSLVCKVFSPKKNVLNGEIIEFDYTEDSKFINWMK